MTQLFQLKRRIYKNKFGKKIVGIIKIIYVKIIYNTFSYLQSRNSFFKMTCLNLGLVLPKNQSLDLLEEDEENRIFFQLYYYACRTISFTGKTVLEVGCSMGGGCYFIDKYLGSRHIKGIDIIGSQIKIAQKRFHKKSLSFETGNACKMKPLAHAYDIVVNIESSHGYQDFSAFVAGVYDTLRPEGVFIFADIRFVYDIDELESDFSEQGFSIAHRENISPYVLKSLDISDARKRKIRSKLPFLRVLFPNFAYLKGSRNYRYLRDGKLVFMHYILTKNG